MKIKSLLKRLQLAVWTFKQPLALCPRLSSEVISDLFVWRSDENWQTFFELIDISSLFEDGCAARDVRIVFFDPNGQQLLDKRIALNAKKRKSLNVSKIIGQSHGEHGTFAVFHEAIPRDVTRIGSHLAERGYVSYCYRNAPLKAYVHGNFDAISKTEDGVLQLLGGVSFLSREYHLQHKIESGVIYELCLVNPSQHRQKFLCKLISAANNEVIELSVFELNPGGAHLFSIQLKDSSEARLIIRSRLIMARPIVFRIFNLNLDVFHG